MKLFGRILAKQQHYLPVYAQQATYLLQASKALTQMMDSLDGAQWRRLEKEVKACEVQGDALLTELHEQLYENIFSRVRRSDIQSIAMSIDEFLDHVNDAAKSVLLYMPKRIDPQVKDLAQYIESEADAVKSLVSYLGDIRRNYSQIALQCDRITELEHAADDAYEEYVGFIFTNEKDPIELMKYKNIAEVLEAATDSAKRISDNVRRIALKYVE